MVHLGPFEMCFWTSSFKPRLAKHCNFAIFGGKASGIFRFITGFYRIKVMPTEFQRIMEDNFIEVQNVSIFVDDVSIVTKGAKGEHEANVREVFLKLDRKLQLRKLCQIAKNDWLG